MSRKETVRKSYTSQPTSSSAKYDAFSAQERIKELEHQVSDLKHRLDELRKAKNQTIIKKDKEYVSVGGVSQGQRRTSQTEDKNKDAKTNELLKQRERQIKEQGEEIKELKSTIQRQEQDMETLKKSCAQELDRLTSEMEALKKEKKELSTKGTENENTSEDLEQLRKENASLRENSDHLVIRNEQLQCRVDDLLEELSKKEAQWCDREEKLKLELKASWGERYHEWMIKTEAKIKELQEANNFLKNLLDREMSSDN